MRLIAGLLRFDGVSANTHVLQQMAEGMTPAHLHPALACAVDGPAGVAVIDFSGESQGLFRRAAWLIAADARLDDPVDECESTFLEAVSRHGRDFPDHVNGDFGVALWDSERQALWLGRDFMGVRPLVWTWNPGQWFAFASLPKGLHAAKLASRDFDALALATKVTQTYFSGADSGFADIRYLEAGHSLYVRADAKAPPQTHRAYRPDPSRVGTWRGSAEQAAQTLRVLVEKAVTVRMPASGVVASHLTGGLDSSSITVIAARQARERQEHIMALNFGAQQALGPVELDERPLIAEVLRQEPNIIHRSVPDRLPMPGQVGDPDWPGSILGGPDDTMMAAAAEFGADRVLSGVGGDEGATYNGANLYLALLRCGRLPTLIRELAARARTDAHSLPKVVIGRLVLPLLATWGIRRRRVGVLDNRRGGVRYLASTIRGHVAGRRFQPVLSSNTAADRTKAFADHHIPSRCTYYAIMAARHGIAATFPLLDRRIVDFALSLPVHFLVADGQSRQPYRNAMRDVLPERVRIARHKVGLFDHRFLLYSQCREELLAELARLRTQGVPLVREMFDLDAIRAGVELLPIPAQKHLAIRQNVGSLVFGHPAWIAAFAVEALILASGLDHGLSAASGEPGAPPLFQSTRSGDPASPSNPTDEHSAQPVRRLE